jgi:hypothetical protein
MFLLKTPKPAKIITLINSISTARTTLYAIGPEKGLMLVSKAAMQE